MDTKIVAPHSSSILAPRGRWLTAFMAAAILVLISVAPIAASSQSVAPACSGANLRTSASTSATVKTSLSLTSAVTVSDTVSGSSWGTNCPNWKAGSSWYTVTHIDGQSVSSLYGVALLYAATGVLTATSTPTSAAPPDATPAPPSTLSPTPPPTSPPTPIATSPTPAIIQASTFITAPLTWAGYAPACSGAKLRTSATTSGTVKSSLGLAKTVTVSATVRGSWWTTICPTRKSGSTWYRVTHVNGRSVSSLFGVSALYAATGVLVAKVVTAPAPTTPPTDTLATDPTPTATPTPGTPAPATPTPGTPAPATPTPGTPAPATPTPGTPVPATPTPAAVPIDVATTQASAGTPLVPACGGINLRTNASTSAPATVKLGFNDLVVVSGTVSGGSWSAACPTATSGSTWYVIVQVNGQSVAALYGVANLYAATGVLANPTTASSTGVVTLGAPTAFYGRGYGHGVGLSQYGARGRALAGQVAGEILAHYYLGTTPGTMSVDTQIRVLVLDNFVPTDSAPLTIYGRGGTWTVDGIPLEIPAEARLRVFPPGITAGWQAVIESATGEVLFDGPIPADFRVTPTTDATTIQLFSKPSTRDLYRGSLRMLMSGSTLDVINQVTLESYLRGVVPSEMPTSWPVESRIAQTIVARSYAAGHLIPGGTFDVYDDTRSQVYLGVRQEHPDADAIIALTAGQILMSGSSIANAMFSSTAGGWTENNENVFVSPTGAKTAGVVSYLRGSSDRDPSGVSYDAGAPFATWQTNVYTATQLSGFFALDARTNVGAISALDLRNRGVSGRLISVTLIGSIGTKTVSGSVFIAVFNAYRPSGDPILRSTLLDVAPIP